MLSQREWVLAPQYSCTQLCSKYDLEFSGTFCSLSCSLLFLIYLYTFFELCGWKQSGLFDSTLPSLLLSSSWMGGPPPPMRMAARPRHWQVILFCVLNSWVSSNAQNEVFSFKKGQAFSVSMFIVVAGWASAYWVHQYVLYILMSGYPKHGFTKITAQLWFHFGQTLLIVMIPLLCCPKLCCTRVWLTCMCLRLFCVYCFCAWALNSAHAYMFRANRERARAAAVSVSGPNQLWVSRFPTAAMNAPLFGTGDAVVKPLSAPVNSSMFFSIPRRIQTKLLCVWSMFWIRWMNRCPACSFVYSALVTRKMCMFGTTKFRIVFLCTFSCAR